MLEKLFSPISIGAMEVKNRIAMTAMGNHLADPGGEVSDDDVAFYCARAEGGVGLIITECIVIDWEGGKGNLRQLAASDDKHVPGLRRLAGSVQQKGAKLVGQIYHPGRQGLSALNGNLPMPAPSDVECQLVHQPVRAMSAFEIKEMIGRFRDAARRLREAGFDGVEIHAAHGYLVNQFLSPYTNKRTDEYGGSLENRMRFLLEIIAAVRGACGPPWPLLVRLTVDEMLEAAGRPGQGLALADGVEIAKALEAAGADAIDVSCGIYETMNTSWEPMGFEQGWKLHMPEAVKRAVKIPVIGVSVLRDPQAAEEAIAQGKLDLAGSARQHYADPNWARKAANGQAAEIRKCVSCLNCMRTLMEADETGSRVGCSINIATGREREYGHVPKNGEGRTVAVIGAGPAGLEAARVLALRGFRPVLFEKRPKIGGQLLLAAAPPGKEKLLWLLEWLRRRVEAMGIETRLSAAPTLDVLKHLDPWAVIVAQGSKPLRPASIPGSASPDIHDPWTVLEGRIALSGRRTLVVGSGLTGIETALYLASRGQKVTVYEMAPQIGPGVFFQKLIDILSRLAPYGVPLHPAHKLIKVSGMSALFERTTDRQRVEAVFDDLVLALGAVPETALVDDIKASFERVQVVGDAARPGRIREAVEAGFQAAFRL